MRPRVSMALLFNLLWAVLGFAQEAELNAPGAQRSRSPRFLGVDRCERCHQAPTQADIDAHVTDFVLLNESKIWMNDIHSQAYHWIDPAVSELSKQICDKLAIPDISQAQQCLSCHSNWLAGDVRPSTYTRGVACESCHGPSELWDVPHSRAEWRTKPVAEKVALGMIDVRNPIERAEQCFGCHVGNVEQGKVITHAMYAAGHPPLPALEIESFAQQMPRHWRYPDEKIAAAKSMRLENEAAILAHNHRAAAVVLGGAVALRESIELMRDIAVVGDSAKLTWPELATYDCRSCHHELESPSSRQQQRIGSIPGRPMASSWPATLIRLSIRHVTLNRPSYNQKLAEFQNKLAAVQAELQRTPFGSPTLVHDACTQLSEWLTDEVIAPVSAKPFDDRAVADAINVLIVIGSTEQHDYDAARQIAWALRMLSCDAAPDELRASAIAATLDALGPSLRLDLANGPAHSCSSISASEDSRQLTPLADNLSKSLAAPIEFDADQFRQQLQKLREKLRK